MCLTYPDVSLDKDDQDVLKFDNENDIYNISVYDINTNEEIPRINIFIEMNHLYHIFE